ncbi:unnamed protein product [marine sediment metagenome]|uniref:Uncharacterized protein n=1 Tax=marine sediment metagenome TaxID=412755 RepID=X1PQR4_9ZZZZ
MGCTMSIIKNTFGSVKSFIKINPLVLIILIALVGIVLLLRRSRSWKESFGDTFKIVGLLGKLGGNLIALFLNLFINPYVKMFQEADQDVGV